jgi:hypothetical protein
VFLAEQPGPAGSRMISSDTTRNQPLEIPVNRTRLAAAAFIAATALATSAAQACISCEYVPEVVRQHSTLNEAPSYHKSRSYSAGIQRSERAAKARVVRSQRADKPVKAAAVEKTDRPAKVAKAAKSVEKSTIANADPIEAPRAESESSSISVAVADAATKDTAPVANARAKEAAAKPTDCKKFFASVGMTLTVPCE